MSTPDAPPPTPDAVVIPAEFVVNRDGRRFALYAGLLAVAHSKGLKGISTSIVQIPSELNGMTAIVHAVVTLEQDGVTKEFMGLGDANPTNVTRMMAPHLIRMAETRSKARALRDAINVGMTSFEELGEDAGARRASASTKRASLGQWGCTTARGSKTCCHPPSCSSFG